MPFNPENIEYINKYCEKHLPDNSWIENEFNFIKDKALKERVIIEYKNARFLYKMFEGLNAKNDLPLAEIRLQILMYASIYETIIHYVLFDEYYKDDTRVKKILVQRKLKEYDIPTKNLQKISNVLKHDSRNIIPCFRATEKRDITKVRFDEKCLLAKELGILYDIKFDNPKIDEDGNEIKYVRLCDDLISIYELRNGIHIHAELKKEIEYQLSMSKIAYKRLKPFIEQIKEKLYKDKKINL